MTNKNWFTCRIRYQKLDESGKEVKATESYLLDAYSFTEAETRIIDLMTEMITGNFQVVNITKSNLAEVIPSEEDTPEKWFKVKVALIIYDEDSGKEKQSNQYVLIAANDVKDAYERTQESMRGSVSSYVIPSISYTKIVEVFAYSEEEQFQHKMEERGLKPMEEMVSTAAAMSQNMQEASEAMNSSDEDEDSEAVHQEEEEEDRENG